MQKSILMNKRLQIVVLGMTTLMSTTAFAKSYFVATNGSSSGNGASIAPFGTFKDACAIAKPGDIIYLRKGTYTNPGYGNGNKGNNSIPAIGCVGSPSAYITIRPYGTEKVKIAFDSFVGIRLEGNYINFDGFEVVGRAQNITYNEALADWWIGSNLYNGNGIVINGHHINVKNNIVHDTPGSAIYINEGGDYSNITDNIIYNAAWWSTKGTTAIGMVTAKSSNGSTTQNIKAMNNLVFASESRIFSRVPTKGFAELKIDEGSGTLIQVNEGNYRGRYLIKDNFYLFNGKGITSSSTNNVDIQNNTLYMNDTTISGKFTGLRLDAVKGGKVSNNAIAVDITDLAYSVTKGTSVSLSKNYLQGGDDVSTLPAGMAMVSNLFTDPANLNFSVRSSIPNSVQIGASMTVWNKLKQKADNYGIKIKPTNWTPDYVGQTKAIIDGVPAGSTLDYSQWPSKVLVTFPAGVTFGGYSTFELRIDTPYPR